MAPKVKNLLSGRAAAKYLNMADATFKRWVDAGLIPFVTDPLTARKKYPRLGLDEWMRRSADNVKKAS